MGSVVPVCMATAWVSIQRWICLYSFSVALHVGSTTGNSLLVGLVFHFGRSLYFGSLVLVTVLCDGAGYPAEVMVL
eukprot:3607625-Pyramimonas_sp.AAC.1